MNDSYELEIKPPKKHQYSLIPKQLTPTKRLFLVNQNIQCTHYNHILKKITPNYFFIIFFLSKSKTCCMHYSPVPVQLTPMNRLFLMNQNIQTKQHNPTPEQLV